MKTCIGKVLVWTMFLCSILGCKDKKAEIVVQDNSGNLVVANQWFIEGPSVESESTINAFRKANKIVRVTTNSAPVGEIELNVMITSSGSNDGAPTNLPNSSTYVEIIYKSSHPIKIQAREGTADGKGCVHGGVHPTADLPASPTSFTTIKIPWSSFKLNGATGERLLDTNNLCKFNFVNYQPIAGAVLEISSVKIENYK